MLGLRATESHTHAKEMTVKVKQLVEATFSHFYIGWNSIQFTDAHDNKISIEASDEQLLTLSDQLAEKAAKIREERDVIEEGVNE